MSGWSRVGRELSFGVESADVFGGLIAAGANGGFTAFWTQTGWPGDASGTAVVSRRYGSDYSFSADLQINATTAGDQTAGAVVALSGGGTSYIWADASGTGGDPGSGIKGSWFYSDAGTFSYERRINIGVAGDQVDPVAATFGVNPLYAVGWTDLGAPMGTALRLQFFNERAPAGGGHAVGRDDRVNDQLAIAGSYFDTLATAWRERTTAGSIDGIIRAQLFTTYAPSGDAFDIGIGTGDASIAWMADGRLVIVWTAREAGGSSGIRARIFTADGIPDSGEIAVNTRVAGDQHDAVVTALAAGGFAVLWTDDTRYGEDARAQLFDNGGTRYGSEIRVGAREGDQYDAAMTTLASGELLVSWTDRSADGDRDVRAQVFTLAAAPAPVGTPGNDRLTGSTGADTIDGLAGDDVIAGSSGNDILIGGLGADYLAGNAGDDTLYGGADNDVLTDSTWGIDRLDGGSGDDTIDVLRNNDPAQDQVMIVGGEGNDSLSYLGSGSILSIDAGAGDDLIRLYLDNADATVTLGDGHDVIRFEIYFPGYFREPTLRITDFVTGEGGDQIDLTPILSADAFRTGAISLRQNGTDVELAGRGENGGPVEVVVAVFANHLVGEFTAYNFSGMSLPEIVVVAQDGARYDNHAHLVGKPAVILSGEGVTFVNASDGSVALSPADESDPTSAALVVTGANTTIINAAGGRIVADSGSYQAILGSDFADSVRNFGLIQGYVRLAGGADRYVEQVGDSNSFGGRIIDLGDGNDRATLNVATFGDLLNVSVIGGAGDDRLAITGVTSRQEVRFNSIAGVETVAFEGESGATVSLQRNGQTPMTMLLDDGLELLIPYSVFGGPVYTGPARGTVLLNGGSLEYGPDVAFDRIIGSDAAESVELGAQLLPPSISGTATNAVMLGGGDDRFVFNYGNRSPRVVDGGDGHDFLSVSQFDERLDLSAFRGFETIEHFLAIGRDTAFSLIGVSTDTRQFLLGGFARDTALNLDFGAARSLSVGLNEQHVIVSAGTTLGTITDRAIVDATVTATDQWIENRGHILGDVTLGAGNDRFASSGEVSGIVRGGAGDDIYGVERAFAIVEATGEGHDTVIAAFDYRLGQNVEDLILTGAALKGIGNTLDNAITGDDATNRLSGLNGNDILSGGGGMDTLDGGAGADILWGGAGRDRLTGGAGADVFAFAFGDSTSRASDLVADFHQAEGDRLDLSAIDANPATPERDALAFRGTAGFSGAGGEVGFAVVGTDTFLHVDIDGDKIADFSLKLAGQIPLNVSDLIF